jgi:hypothetical protein
MCQDARDAGSPGITKLAESDEAGGPVYRRYLRSISAW